MLFNVGAVCCDSENRGGKTFAPMRCSGIVDLFFRSIARQLTIVRKEIPMDQERSAKLRVLFHDALEREPQERSAFLDARCEGDLDLRREVQQLLDCEPVVGTFLETPA